MNSLPPRGSPEKPIKKDPAEAGSLFSSAMQACEAVSVLASLAELDVRVTFLSQAQVDHGRRDIGEVVTAIEG